MTLFFSVAGVPFIHMSVCFWTAHTLKQAWADEQFVVPAPPNTSAFMQSLLCQCWKPTVSGCIGAHSGSHTHSEPRIVIIFSELLQIDRQTEWVDRQMCTQTDREREDQIGNQEQGWKQGPKLKQANRCPMQETDHHCWNYTGQQLQWIWTHIHIIGWLTEEKQRERGRTEEERTDAMDADFKLNITRGSGRDFLSDLPTPAQNLVLPFKTPPTHLCYWGTTWVVTQRVYSPAPGISHLQCCYPDVTGQSVRCWGEGNTLRSHKEPCKSQMY